jgi:dTDP-D-glucose 4,6-dehydratase
MARAQIVNWQTLENRSEKWRFSAPVSNDEVYGQVSFPEPYSRTALS